MATVGKLFRRFAACHAGATGAEYAICTALVITVAIAAIAAIGGLTSGVRELTGVVAQHSGGGPDLSHLLIHRTEEQ